VFEARSTPGIEFVVIRGSQFRDRRHIRRSS
jgi:hypothetical protein